MAVNDWVLTSLVETLKKKNYWYNKMYFDLAKIFRRGEKCHDNVGKLIIRHNIDWHDLKNYYCVTRWSSLRCTSKHTGIKQNWRMPSSKQMFDVSRRTLKNFDEDSHSPFILYLLDMKNLVKTWSYNINECSYV